MLIKRRSLIKSCLVASASAALPCSQVFANTSSQEPMRKGSQLDRLVPSITPIISMQNAHTDEIITRKFFGPTGYDLDALNDINWMFRDWREDEVLQVDLRVLWALAAIRMAAMKEDHSGDMILLSGFRTKKTNEYLRSKGIGAARNSLHLKAQASDFRMEGVPVQQIATYARWLEVGGVGEYVSSRFVHIDSGEIRNWEPRPRRD